MIDWTAVIIGIVAAIPPTLVGIAILRQGKKTYHTFNSKMDAMLKLTSLEAYARGQKDEKEAHDK